MKSLYLRAGLALLCAVALSACGGGSGSLLLSGSISGLSKDGLVLVNKNTGEKLPITSGSIAFSFTKLASVDEAFDIEVDTQPTGANCVMSNNNTKANAYTAYYIAVVCTTNPYKLGGTVTGLDSNGLVLANGPDTVAVPPPATPGATVSFTFPVTVANGSPFGVTVLAQPQNTSKVCTASNNTGTMPSNDYSPVTIICQ